MQSNSAWHELLPCSSDGPPGIALSVTPLSCTQSINHSFMVRWMSILPGYQLLCHYQSDQLPRLLHIVRLHTHCRLTSERETTSDKPLNLKMGQQLRLERRQDIESKLV